MQRTTRAMIMLLGAAVSMAAIGCAHRDDEASSAPQARFDPTQPTGKIVEPGTERVVEPSDDMEQISFEEAPDAGPTEEVRVAPERKPIPPMRIFGTNGEGPG